MLTQDYRPNPAVRYLFSGPGFNIQLRDDGFSIDRYSSGQVGSSRQTVLFERTDVRFVNTGSRCSLRATGQQKEYRNYYTAGLPAEGITGVPIFQEVCYRGLYPGIDLTFGTPGPDGGFFRFSAGSVRHMQQGSILLNGNPIDASQLESLCADRLRINPVATPVQAPTAPLTDPERIWATYFGGPDEEFCLDVADCHDGTLCLGGSTMSLSNIATAGASQTTCAGSRDLYLARFSTEGVLLWATYFGGTNSEHGGNCCSDATGNVYITGETDSPTGIATPGAHQTVFGGGDNDCLLARFSPAGIRLWATYYGGSGDDQFGGVDADADGKVCMTGMTQSPGNIATTGAHQTTPGGDFDAFLVLFTADGTRLWGSYYGGEAQDDGQDCSFDGNGNVYLCGITRSLSQIATPGCYQLLPGGDQEVFLVKFDDSGNRLWATYFGGSGPDHGWCCSADPFGNIALSGATWSSDNIAGPGAWQATNLGQGDGFIALFSTSGQRRWSSFYGGSGMDNTIDVTSDSKGNFYLSGSTASITNIASPGAFQPSMNGIGDAYLAKFDSTGQRKWGTYVGGDWQEDGWKTAITAQWDVFLCGRTVSSVGLSTPGAYQTALSGGWDGFLVRFRDCEPAGITQQPAGPPPVCEGSTATLQLSALGSQLSYQWQANEGAGFVNLNDLPPYQGAFSPMLTINPLPASLNGASFRCIVTAPCPPSDTSETVALFVNPIPPAPLVTAHEDTLFSDAPNGNQWFHDGTLLPGATQTTLIAQENGWYHSTVTLNGCSSPPSNAVLIILDNLNDRPTEPSLRVFPSPSQGSFSVRYDKNRFPRGTLEIIDQTGITRLTVAFDHVGASGNLHVNTPSLPAGLYILRLTSPDSTTTTKLVITE